MTRTTTAPPRLRKYQTNRQNKTLQNKDIPLAYLASLCSLVDEISCRLLVSAVISFRRRSSWFWRSCKLSSSRAACLSYRSKKPIIPFNTLSSRISLFLSLFCDRTSLVNLLITLKITQGRKTKTRCKDTQ